MKPVVTDGGYDYLDQQGVAIVEFVHRLIIYSLKSATNSELIILELERLVSFSSSRFDLVQEELMPKEHTRSIVITVDALLHMSALFAWSAMLRFSPQEEHIMRQMRFNLAFC